MTPLHSADADAGYWSIPAIHSLRACCAGADADGRLLFDDGTQRAVAVTHAADVALTVGLGSVRSMAQSERRMWVRTMNFYSLEYEDEADLQEALGNEAVVVAVGMVVKLNDDGAGEAADAAAAVGRV